MDSCWLNPLAPDGLGRVLREPEVVLVELGRRIRARRVELGLSQEQLAARGDLHWQSIGELERGRVNAGVLKVLEVARMLDVEPGQLLDGLNEVGDSTGPTSG